MRLTLVRTYKVQIGEATVTFRLLLEKSDDSLESELAKHLTFGFFRFEPEEGRPIAVDFEVSLGEFTADSAASAGSSGASVGKIKQGYVYRRSLFGDCEVRSQGSFSKPFFSRILVPGKMAQISGPGKLEFLAILLETWCGFYLETRGCGRVHAAAFSSDANSASVILARPGFGKSHFIGQLMSTEIGSRKAIADEVVFVFNGKIHPQNFALRLKHIPSELQCLKTQSVESVFGNRSVLPIQKSFDHELAIEKVFAGVSSGKFSRMDLFFEVVLGIGLQQNPELTMAASVGSFLNYARVLWVRLKLYSSLQDKVSRDVISRTDLTAFLRGH
jgi:hypothetical protein